MTPTLPSFLLATIALPAILAAQATPIFVTGSDDGVVLPDVRAAAALPTATLILSEPEPALHLRHADGRMDEWGKKGPGPGELVDPVDLAWGDEGGIVLDMASRRLTAYRPDGSLLWSRSLGQEWANRVVFVGRDTLMQLIVPMTRKRAIVRLHGTSRDTVLAYEITEKEVRLAPSVGPSLTVPEPYTADARWAALPGRGIAFWAPGRDYIAVLNISGTEIGRYPLPSEAYPVTAADRERWFATAIPQKFMGRRVFENAREYARSHVKFPEAFAPVTALAGDPAGRLWVRRTAAGSGELWQLLSGGGSVEATLRLPPERELLAFGPGVAVARGLSQLGEPILEAYRVGMK